MRVLFLLHAHPDLQAGGTEIFARDLFRTLRASGAIEGLFLAGTAQHQRPQSPGTPFQTVGGADDELLMWTAGFDPFFMSQIDLHGVSQPLAGLLAQVQPDLVHVHHLMTLGVEMLGLVRRILPRARIVMTLHDYYAICANDGQMVTTAGALCHAATPDACHRCFPDRGLTDFRLRRLHIGAALAHVDQFIAPSRFLRDRYIAWGLPPDRITLLPNGLPAHEPAPPRPTAGRRDRFAFFGHINRFKGAAIALGASARLSRDGVAHALALHGGTDHQAPETLARFEHARAEAPDSRYCGAYTRRDLPRLIADADWVVFPSEWWENAPLVINEAFQHRRPVICSAIGGAAERVRDHVDGLHFPVGDAAQLAQAMRRAIEEPGLWERLVGGILPPVGIAESAAAHRAFYARMISEAPDITALSAA
jgi:glycosyltransferase involved in cell wall biosynthesis